MDMRCKSIVSKYKQNVSQKVEDGNKIIGIINIVFSFDFFQFIVRQFWILLGNIVKNFYCI